VYGSHISVFLVRDGRVYCWNMMYVTYGCTWSHGPPLHCISCDTWYM